MMERFSFWATLLLSICLTACDSKDEKTEVPAPDPDPVTPVNPPQPPQPEVNKPVAGTYTFVLPDYSPKTAWEAGDAISVRGNYAPGAFVVTLTAADISDDGKTASVEIVELPKTFCPPDYLYAAYPAEDVRFDSDFLEPTTTFAPGGGPMLLAYWEKENVFRFKPANGAVTFTLDAAGYDALVFGGAAREDIRYDYLTATYTSQESLFTRKPSDGHPFFVREIAPDGRYTVFLPTRTQFNGGFCIYLKKGESYPKVYSYTEAVSFKSGQVLELGDITASLTDYDGPAPEEMKMPEIVKRTEYKVNVEELSGIILSADGSFLWGVGDQGQLAKITITDEGQVSVENVKHFGNDLEGVTRDPETDILYFCAEPNSVYRVDPPYTSYTRIFKVADAANYGNSGLEGIAWYKDNTLLVGAQVGANLWRYDLEGNVLDFISLKTVKSSVLEIGGLYYDPVNDWLWVTDSEAHSLFVFSGDARTYYGRFKLSSGYNNESVCVDHARGCVWVGDDNDSQPRIIRLDMEGLTLGQ